jgi:N-acetylmuramoyl-L-alanine amidase
MTTLDNGIVIDESLSAVNFTRQADVPLVWPGWTGEKNACTVHHWGAFGQNIHTVAKYLASKNDRNNSATFVLQEDYVYCLVFPDDSSWHAGNAEGNARTIGIECRPEMTPGDLETLASLIRYLETIYGDLTIYIHSDWMNTACPGTYAGEIENLVAEINGAEVWHVKGLEPPVPPKELEAQPKHHCCCHD